MLVACCAAICIAVEDREEEEDEDSPTALVAGMRNILGVPWLWLREVDAAVPVPPLTAQDACMGEDKLCVLSAALLCPTSIVDPGSVRWLALLRDRPGRVGLSG